MGIGMTREIRDTLWNCFKNSWCCACGVSLAMQELRLLIMAFWNYEIVLRSSHQEFANLQLLRTSRWVSSGYKYHHFDRSTLLKGCDQRLLLLDERSIRMVVTILRDELGYSSHTHPCANTTSSRQSHHLNQRLQLKLLLPHLLPIR
jgi:hypothetical protein